MTRRQDGVGSPLFKQTMGALQEERQWKEEEENESEIKDGSSLG